MAAAEKAHHTTEQERDNLQEEVSSFGIKLSKLMKDNHRLENRITHLEKGLEEKLMTAEMSNGKSCKAFPQIDQLNLELKELSQSSTLEKQVKELHAKVEELETSSWWHLKSQVSRLGGIIAGLEGQLNTLGRNKLQIPPALLLYPLCLNIHHKNQMFRLIADIHSKLVIYLSI